MKAICLLLVVANVALVAVMAASHNYVGSACHGAIAISMATTLYFQERG